MRPTVVGQKLLGAATSVASSMTQVSPGSSRPDELPSPVLPSQNVSGDPEQQGTAEQELENIARSVLHIGLETVGEAAKDIPSPPLRYRTSLRLQCCPAPI